MERITVDNVSKTFRIAQKKQNTTLAGVLSIVSGKESKKEFFALKDVSFSVNGGEIVAVIGKNSCGKSTLLRCISGIYQADQGRIITKGKVVSLIGLDRGVRLRLTMADNISLLGSFLGLGKSSINKQFDAIVAFSGLERFLDTKLYQFSYGMVQRLIFSIGIHCRAEIFLLDEVLAVGDREFRMKSIERITELVRNGAAVLLVTHELWIVEDHCNRAILLNKGEIVRQGATAEIIKEYKKI